MTQRSGKLTPTPLPTAPKPKAARRGSAGSAGSPIGTGVGQKRKQVTEEEDVEDDDEAHDRILLEAGLPEGVTGSTRVAHRGK